MTTLASFAKTLAAASLLLVGGCDDAGHSNSNGAGGDTSAGGAGNQTASRVVSDGYLSAGPWAGYGFTATDPGAATITPDCGAGSCMPAFAGSTFCMKGKVTGRADYTGFAMLGWNINQTIDGDPMTWPVPESGGVAVTVTNDPASVALRVQLQGTDPHNGNDRWCAALESGTLIPWSAFKTNCWQGGSPQNPLTPGTMLQQGSVIVPGLTTDLPFDVCLVDVQVAQ